MLVAEADSRFDIQIHRRHLCRLNEKQQRRLDLRHHARIGDRVTLWSAGEVYSFRWSAIHVLLAIFTWMKVYRRRLKYPPLLVRKLRRDVVHWFSSFLITIAQSVAKRVATEQQPVFHLPSVCAFLLWERVLIVLHPFDPHNYLSDVLSSFMSLIIVGGVTRTLSTISFALCLICFHATKRLINILFFKVRVDRSIVTLLHTALDLVVHRVYLKGLSVTAGLHGTLLGLQLAVCMIFISFHDFDSMAVGRTLGKPRPFVRSSWSRQNFHLCRHEFQEQVIALLLVEKRLMCQLGAYKRIPRPCMDKIFGYASISLEQT